MKGKEATSHLIRRIDDSLDDTGNHADAAAGDAAVAVAVAIPDPKLRRLLLDTLEQASLPVVEENCDVSHFDELVASVERLRPDILFLGLPGLPTDPALMIAKLSTLDPAPRNVAVHDNAEPEMIMKAMRAGAAEFVYPPFTSSTFEDSLRRIIADCGRATHQKRATGSVIGFVSAKGGCGATTLACHSSSHLRQMTKKEVLLADLDLASGITGTIMQSVARYSLDDAVQNLHRMDLKLWKGLVATAPSGVDVIPAPPDISAPSVASISRKVPPMLRFWRMHYDLTILDLGHGITQPLLDVLDSIDTLVLVTTNEVLALRQAKQMIQALALRNLGANRLKLVINRMPKKPPIQLPELEKVMGQTIYAEIPNDYQRLNEAYSEPRLMGLGSELATEIGKFAAKLTGFVAEDKKRRGFFGLRSKK